MCLDVKVYTTVCVSVIVYTHREGPKRVFQLVALGAVWMPR